MEPFAQSDMLIAAGILFKTLALYCVPGSSAIIDYDRIVPAFSTIGFGCASWEGPD